MQLLGSLSYEYRKAEAMHKFANWSAIACLGIILLTTHQAFAQIIIKETPIPQTIPLACYLQAAKTLKDDQLLAEAVKRHAAEGQPNSNNKFFSQVLQVINAIKDSQVRDSFLSWIQKTYIELGQYAQARRLVNEASQTDTRAYMLSLLAHEYAEIGQKAQALELISQVLSLARKSNFKGELPLPIIESYTVLGQFDQALKATENLVSGATRAEALTDIANAYIKAGQPEQATKVLTQALQITKLIKSEPRQGELEILAADPEYPELPLIFSDKERLPIAIATSYERIGNSNSASLTSLEVLADPKDRTDTLLWLVRSHAEAGLYQPALRIANTIQNQAEKKYALFIIVNSHLKAGQVEQALKLVESVVEPYLQSAALGTVAAKYTQLGKRDRALRLLEQASRIANSIDSITTKSEALIELASHYAKLKDNAQADRLVTQALKLDRLLENSIALLTIADYQQKIKRLIDVVEVYAEIGQYEKAVQLANTIDSQERKSRASAWQAIASAYVRNGQAEQALNTIKVFKTKFPEEYKYFYDDPILQDVVIHYVEKGQFDRALQVAKTITWKSGREKWVSLIDCARK